MNKIEHLGIAVKNIESAGKIFSDVLNVPPYKSETVASEGVKTTFYQIGDSKIELLEATTEDSPIAKFIEKKGEGIHHIAFDVTNIYEEIERLQSKGYKLIHEQPKDGADNKIIAFMHPKDTSGVLIELCQEKD